MDNTFFNTPAAPEKEKHLLDYWYIVRKRLLVVIALAVFVLAISILRTQMIVPMYRATTDVLVERNLLQGVGEIGRYFYYDPNFKNTQLELMRSAKVARRVVVALDLTGRYKEHLETPSQVSFTPRAILSSALKGIAPVLTYLKDTLGMDSSSSKPPPLPPLSSAEDLENAKIDNLVLSIASRVEVEQIRETNIVRIGILDRNPQMAAMIVNALASAYMDELLEMQMHNSGYVIGWMNKKADEEREKLEASERALQQYMKENNMVTAADQTEVAPGQIESLSEQKMGAQTRIKELEEIIRQIEEARKNKGNLETLSAIADNESFHEIQRQVEEASRVVSELGRKYGPKHPHMIKAVTDRKVLARQKGELVGHLIDQLGRDYELAVKRVQNIDQLLSDARGEAIDINEKFIQLNIMKRDVESNRSIYNTLIKNIKEQSLTEQTQSVNVLVVRTASPPSIPAYPDKKKNFLRGVLMGLLAGVGFAFFLEYLDNTIKNVDDAEKRFGLTVLGVIERYKTGLERFDDPIATDPRSSFAESYKILQSSLLLSSADSPPKLIHITSVVPAEGKTTTTVNLARTLSLTGSKVIIVDCDLRKPRIHKYFGLANAHGLSEFLAGTLPENQPLIQQPGGNIDVITSGPLPPNPSELLHGKQLPALFEKLRGKYDFILVDSPPVLSVTDSLILSNYVDGSLMVARTGKTTNEVIYNGIKRLRGVNAHLLGMVLNVVRMKKGGYYYYQGYYSYQGYYYQDGENQERKKRKKRRSKEIEPEVAS